MLVAHHLLLVFDEATVLQMKINKNRSWLVLLLTLIVCLTKQAKAQVPQWIATSDIVCIAKVVTITKETEDLKQGNYEYSTYQVELNVQNTFKGTITKNSLYLTFYSLDMSQGGTFSGYYPYFSGYKPDSTYLIFASMHNGVVQLVNPYIGSQSAVSVDSISPSILSTNPPVINVLFQLTTCCSSADRTIQLRALTLLGDFSVYVTQQSPANDIGSDQDNINQPLSKLVLTVAIPKVLLLTHSQDDQIRFQALFEAARLQVVSVIPQLVSLSTGSSTFSSLGSIGLQQFRSENALSSLVRLSNSNNINIEMIVINYLRQLQDKRGVPFLLDALTSTDLNVRYTAIIALSEILGEISPQMLANMRPDNDETQLKFWKNWATVHHSEVVVLRRDALGVASQKD